MSPAIDTAERSSGANGIPGTGGAPPAGFEDPLALLSQSHRRTEMRCGLLERLEEHLLAHDCDDRGRVAATTLLEHFDVGARLHTADEEIDVLPALQRAVSRRQKRRVNGLIADLMRSHAALAAAWQPLRMQLGEVARGVRARLDQELVARFATLVLAHIAREENEVLPAAAKSLGRDALRRIGCAMAARRTQQPS